MPRFENEKNIFTERDFKSFTPSYRPQKHCPECALVGYHHFMFDLPYITDCPIHNRPLENTCQVCEKPWPSCLELLSRRCEGCTTSDVSVRLKKSLKMQETSAMWHNLLEIEQFLQNTQADDRLSSSQRHDQRFYKGGIQKIISVANMFDASFGPLAQALASKKIAQLSKNVGDVDIITGSLNLSELDTSTKMSLSVKSRKQIEKESLAAICEFIQNMSKSVHKITIHLTCGRNLYTIDISNYCPFCTAVSFWYYIVTNKLRLEFDNNFQVNMLAQTNDCIYNLFSDDIYAFEQGNFIADEEFKKEIYRINIESFFYFLFERFIVIARLPKLLGRFTTIEELISTPYFDEHITQHKMLYCCDLTSRSIFTTVTPFAKGSMISAKLLSDEIDKCTLHQDVDKAQFEGDILRCMSDVHQNLFIVEKAQLI